MYANKAFETLKSWEYGAVLLLHNITTLRRTWKVCYFCKELIHQIVASLFWQLLIDLTFSLKHKGLCDIIFGSILFSMLKILMPVVEFFFKCVSSMQLRKTVKKYNCKDKVVKVVFSWHINVSNTSVGLCGRVWLCIFCVVSLYCWDCCLQSWSIFVNACEYPS